MPTYTWACHDCELYWERDYKMGKAPEKTKCPGCEKRKGRSYDAPALRFIGSGFYVNDYGKNTIAHANAKGACEEFIEDAKKSSKERSKTGFQNYKVYTPNLGELEAMGQIKKMEGNSEEIINSNAARYRKFSERLYKEANIDPEKQEKTNVDLLTQPDRDGLV